MHFSGRLKVFTAADAFVVEHDSLVAAELKLLQRGVACHDGGFWHREEDAGQQGAGQAGLFKQLKGGETYRGKDWKGGGSEVETDRQLPAVSALHLQIDALGTVDDLEVEDLAKVHPEIGAQGAAVSAGHLLVVVEDLDIKRAPGNVFPASDLGPDRQTDRHS